MLRRLNNTWERRTGGGYNILLQEKRLKKNYDFEAQNISENPENHIAPKIQSHPISYTTHPCDFLS